MSEMTPNEMAIRIFCAQFSPPLVPHRTERVNGVQIPDCWTANYHNQGSGLGVTAVAHSGNFQAFLEGAGPGEVAERAGRAIATALGLFKGGSDGDSEAEGGR